MPTPRVLTAHVDGVCFECGLAYAAGDDVTAHQRVARQYAHTVCPLSPRVRTDWNLRTVSKDASRRLHPELTRWWTTETLPESVAAWTDVLVDMRDMRYRTTLRLNPKAKGVTLPMGSDAQGWKVDSQTVCDDNFLGLNSFIRFTAPDGFRFAVVLSKSNSIGGLTLPVKRMCDLFPTMRTVFYGAGSPIDASAASGPRETYDLAALRRAVENPDKWFGDDAARYAVDVQALTVMFGWAVLGFGGYSAAHQWEEYGLTPVNYLHWRETWAEAEMAVLLMVMDGGQHAVAYRWADAGWCGLVAAHWIETLKSVFPAHADPKLLTLHSVLARFRDAGATAEEVRDLLEAFAYQPPVRGGRSGRTRPRGMHLNTALSWLAIDDPQRRVAYVRAGLSLREAIAFESSPERPSMEALATLAGLLPPRRSPAGSFAC